MLTQLLWGRQYAAARTAAVAGVITVSSVRARSRAPPLAPPLPRLYCLAPPPALHHSEQLSCLLSIPSPSP